MNKRRKQISENIQAVKCWLFSFIPLVIATVMFVLCFIFESALWLYMICTVVFALFVLLYVRADKAICQSDGYTLIQAIQFYLACLKAGIGENLPSDVRKRLTVETAALFEFTKEMKPNKIEQLYRCGQELTRYFNFEGFSKYV